MKEKWLDIYKLLNYLAHGKLLFKWLNKLNTEHELETNGERTYPVTEPEVPRLRPGRQRLGRGSGNSRPYY